MGMTTDTESRPLWYQIEEQIGALKDSDLTESAKEKTVHKVAATLDEGDLNVSNTGRRLLSLRWALDARIKTGHPLIDDLNDALSKFALDDLEDVKRATYGVVNQLGEAWPNLKQSDRVADIHTMIDAIKLDLTIQKAKDLGEDAGIRYLREQNLPTATILERLETSQEKLNEVDAAIAAERAEITRVEHLLANVANKAELDQIKHLISNEVSDDFIVRIAKVTEKAIGDARKAMEEEIKEKARLAAEEAARKQAEADGPPLESISSDDMLGFIEEIRDILEFSDAEKEIRVMCGQSDIPKCLIDIAVSEPDRLDELEEQAEA